MRKESCNWEVVDDDEVVVMPDRVIRCRFDLNHEVFAGSFYDVRWFRADDRGKLSKSPASGSNCGITPSPSERSIADRHKVGPQSAAHQRGRDQAAQSRRGSLAFKRRTGLSVTSIRRPPGGLP